MSSRVTKGMPVGRDGYVHTTFTHQPSTLRLSSRAPNLQNVPRGDDSEIQKLVKGMFVAPKGWTFWARDFAGIEAVLVGVEAGSQRYTRLAKLGVHSWVCAHLLNHRGKIPTADLPQLSWTDSDLSTYFSDIKKRFKPEREVAKRCVHAGNYLATAGKLHEEYPQYFPTKKDAAWLLRFYFDLFDEIPRWHERLCRQVDKTTTVRNAFGYVHRFYRVLEWSYDRGSKDWVWSYGDDAKRLVAFGPQSTAAGIMKEAMLRMRQEAPLVTDTLRLTIHDELFGMAQLSQVEHCLVASKRVMEAPIPQIPLAEDWGLGPFLTVGTEAKVGPCWGEMKTVAD